VAWGFSIRKKTIKAGGDRFPADDRSLGETNVPSDDLFYSVNRGAAHSSRTWTGYFSEIHDVWLLPEGLSSVRPAMLLLYDRQLQDSSETCFHVGAIGCRVPEVLKVSVLGPPRPLAEELLGRGARRPAFRPHAITSFAGGLSAWALLAVLL